MRKFNLSEILLLDLQRYYNLSSLNDSGNKVKVIMALHPRFIPIICIRFSYFFYEIPFFKVFSHLLNWFNIIIFGIEYTPKCKIGHGLVIPHSNGIVLGALSIGENVTIFQGVTLGAKKLDMFYHPETRPTIGNNVTIGTGAKILGGIHIGDNVVVGANSVVLCDIPNSVVVAGIPATIVKK